MIRSVRLAAIAGVAFSAAGLFTPQVAQATLIQIDITGMIFDSYDETGSLFGLGAGDDTAVGQAIAVSYRIDTALVPAASGATPGYAYHVNECAFGATSWLSSTASVGGSVLPGAVAAGNMYDCDKASVYNDYATPEVIDALLLSSEAWEWVNALDFMDRRANDSIQLSGDATWLSSVALDQAFTVTTPGNMIGFLERINYSYEFVPGVGFSEPQYWNGFARYQASSATAYEVTVPEPATLGLFSLGLLGIGAARLRRTSSLTR